MEFALIIFSRRVDGPFSLANAGHLPLRGGFAAAFGIMLLLDFMPSWNFVTGSVGVFPLAQCWSSTWALVTYRVVFEERNSAASIRFSRIFPRM